jgi:hypothetical protein
LEWRSAHRASLSVIENRAESEEDGDGGGIYNRLSSTMTLQDSTINENVGVFAGGLWNSGTLSWTGGELAGNTAQFGAGGIRNGGTASLTAVLVRKNRAGAGGGIESVEASLTVLDSVIFANQAGAGGGVEIRGGTATLTNTRVDSNTAAHGAGIRSSGNLSVVDSTVSGNTASSGRPASRLWGSRARTPACSPTS